MREIYDARRAPATHERAAEIDAELRPVYEAMTVTANPIPVKTALELLGRDRRPPAAADGPRLRGERDDGARRRSSAHGLLVAGGAG